jgi:hypothetical protein
MKIQNKNFPYLKPTKILTLQGYNCQKDYFVLKNEEGRRIYMLEEHTGDRNKDYYTLFYSWEKLIAELTLVQSTGPSKNRWWTYCPAWANFKPYFIHEKLKGYFNRQLAKAMQDVALEEMAQQEKMKFKTWMKACKSVNKPSQMALFN